LTDVVDPAELIAGLVTLPFEEQAAQIVRLYLTTFGTPGSSPLSLSRAAATNEQAARLLRESNSLRYSARRSIAT
jgi:hypothetical protein